MNRRSDIIQRDLERLKTGVDIRREDEIPAEWNITSAELSRISSADVLEISGRKYLRAKGTGRIFSCDASLPGGESLLRMTALILSNAGAGAERIEDICKGILEGEYGDAEAGQALKKHGVSLNVPKQVLVMKLMVPAGTACDQLEELIPLQDGDVLIDVSKYEAVLVRTAQEDEEELLQYAEALQDTVMTETGLNMDMGIGMRVSGILDVRKSYQQALEALELGSRFTKKHGVFAYRNLSFERFLATIPRKTAESYLSEMLSTGSEKVLSDEMLETVEVFFRKDLNLSDTSRQLIMHRNTLVYRLDKIQKATGLDLRHFQDAVQFKVLMELRKLLEINRTE